MLNGSGLTSTEKGYVQTAGKDVLRVHGITLRAEEKNLMPPYYPKWNFENEKYLTMFLVGTIYFLPGRMGLKPCWVLRN